MVKTLQDIRGLIRDANAAADAETCDFMAMPPVRLPRSYKQLDTDEARGEWLINGAAKYRRKVDAHLSEWFARASALNDRRAGHRRLSAITAPGAPPSGLGDALPVLAPASPVSIPDASCDAAADFGY